MKVITVEELRNKKVVVISKRIKAALDILYLCAIGTFFVGVTNILPVPFIVIGLAGGFVAVIFSLYDRIITDEDVFDLQKELGESN